MAFLCGRQLSSTALTHAVKLSGDSKMPLGVNVSRNVSPSPSLSQFKQNNNFIIYIVLVFNEHWVLLYLCELPVSLVTLVT